MFFEEGKRFLVMRANFAMYTLLSLFPQISLSFSFLSSFTFNSLFRFHWLLCCSSSLLLLFPYSWVLFLLYPTSSPGDFPYLPLFSPTILFAVGIRPTPTTYRSSSVQVGSIPLLGFTTNFLIFLVKDNLSYTIFPKVVLAGY